MCHAYSCDSATQPFVSGAAIIDGLEDSLNHQALLCVD